MEGDVSSFLSPGMWWNFWGVSRYIKPLKNLPFPSTSTAAPYWKYALRLKVNPEDSQQGTLKKCRILKRTWLFQFPFPRLLKSGVIGPRMRTGAVTKTHRYSQDLKCSVSFQSPPHIVSGDWDWISFNIFLGIRCGYWHNWTMVTHLISHLP